MKIIKFLENLLINIKSLFLSGLFTIIPLAVTIFFIHFSYALVMRWISPFKEFEPSLLQQIPGIEIIIFIIAVIIIGTLVKYFIITPLIHKIEKVINKIPLVRIIYSASKKLVDFFQLPAAISSSQTVVLVEFPQKESYKIGFLLDSAKNDYEHNIRKTFPNQQKNFSKVFIPSSPIPTTGFFLIVSEDKIVYTDMTFEDALKAVVSCGLITPDTIKK